MWANSPPFRWNLVKWSIGAVDIIVSTCPVLTSEAPVARLKASGFVVLNSRVWRCLARGLWLISAVARSPASSYFRETDGLFSDTCELPALADVFHFSHQWEQSNSAANYTQHPTHNHLHMLLFLPLRMLLRSSLLSARGWAGIFNDPCLKLHT